MGEIDIKAVFAEQIETLKERLKDKTLSKVQRELLEKQLRQRELSLEQANESSSSKFDEGETTPEGMYVSECIRVVLKEAEFDGKTSFKALLIMQPIKRLEFDEDDKLNVVDVSSENLGQHFLKFNKSVKMIQNPESSTISAISRFFTHLSVDVKKVANINPGLLDEQKLVGLRVIENITHTPKQDGSGVWVNSSVGAADGQNLINRGQGAEAKEVKKHNKPILSDFLEVQTYLGVEAVPYVNV